MAIKKKGGGGGGGANWMDTYGDMVTLLLCFFVLLYSMSTISDAKWKAIVQSFNPSAVQEAAAISGSEGPIDGDDNLGTDNMMLGPEQLDPKDVEAALQALFDALKEYSEQNDMEEVIEVTKGDGYVFVSFADAVFFNGDSAVLRDDGKAILDVVIDAINPAAPYIDELRVMGHTAQADPNRPNRTEGDRRLSSERATNVVIYIQDRCLLDPARLLSVGYGQWRPVDLNDTSEHRAHNRRVELLITGQDIENQLGDSLEQYQSVRTGDASFTSGDGENADAGASAGTEAGTAAAEPPIEG